MRASSICFCDETELLTELTAVRTLSATWKMPRLQDVCTSPGMSMLMAAMPFGTSSRKRTTRSVASSVSACSQAGVGSSVTVTPGSAAAYSFRKSASQAAAISRAAGKSSSRRARTASEAFGMALSFRPPAAETSRKAIFFCIASSTRPSRRFAFARPLSIS